uniref:PRA1 family protein n=1 Tax=Canis lupus familiaris TaxID=9615 RepID=A0A8C0M2Z2_CANLF
MAAEKDQQKDAEPEGLSATTLLPKLIPSGAGREWLERRRATIRPWSSFVDQRRFSRPRNLGELCQRLVRNVEYYQSNYVFVFLGLILYCVPRGEPSPSVCSGRGRLLSLLLAGWCRVCCLLGSGSHPRGHWLPCRLPPDGSCGWGRAADGACVRTCGPLESAASSLFPPAPLGPEALAKGLLPISSPGRDSSCGNKAVTVVIQMLSRGLLWACAGGLGRLQRPR